MGEVAHRARFATEAGNRALALPAVELVGADDIEITGPAKIEEATAGQVSFVANEKYFRHIAQTGASLVLILIAFLFVLMAYYLYTTIHQQRMAER